jgi:N-acetylmuramoyl-L-alanine amidase
VWARQVGSTASYDAYASTNTLAVVSSPAQMVSLTSNVALPATTGTTVKWTAGATGGTAPLEYQFWRQDAGTWRMVRDYSSLNTYSWITTATDVGQHAIQARVRSIGSASAYESQMMTGVFNIQ